jgi:hypothetical protein
MTILGTSPGETPAVAMTTIERNTGLLMFA